VLCFSGGFDVIVQVLQHAPFEGIGNIASWLDGHGATVRCTRLFAEARFPPPGSADLVIAMGGPMSVHDEARFAWLRAEKDFLRQAIDHGALVLGVCLGAQLLAEALGAQVYPNPVKEIGWFAADAAQCTQGAFCFPAQFMAFHWHGETFDLPHGAVRLARTSVCENQAFQVGRGLIGLQFHLEVTDESVRQMLDHGTDEIAQGGAFVQRLEAIRAPAPGTYANVERLMHRVLDYLLAGTAAT